MKFFLPYLLIFISAAAVAQQDLTKKVEPIFATQHYTLTVAGPQGVKMYEFAKHKTKYSVAWFMASNQHHGHKVIWDNYKKLELILQQNANLFYSGTPTFTNPANYVTFTLSSQNQSVSFQAAYINIPKYLRYVGWEPKSGHFHGSTSFRQHG